MLLSLGSFWLFEQYLSMITYINKVYFFIDTIRTILIV